MKKDVVIMSLQAVGRTVTLRPMTDRGVGLVFILFIIAVILGMIVYANRKSSTIYRLSPEQKADILKNNQRDIHFLRILVDEFSHIEPQRSKFLRISKNSDGRRCDIYMSIDNFEEPQQFYFDFCTKMNSSCTIPGWFDIWFPVFLSFPGKEILASYVFERMIENGEITSSGSLDYEWPFTCAPDVFSFLAEDMEEKYPEKFKRDKKDSFSLSFN